MNTGIGIYFTRRKTFKGRCCNGHFKRIEDWILEQAGIALDAEAAPGALRVVAA